ACRLQFLEALFGNDVLLRALQFADYDPELIETLELDRMEGEPRLRPSRLENFWRSYEASCRSLARPAIRGLGHIGWMIFPLAVITVGTLAAPALRTGWNWLPLEEELRGLFANALIFIIGWLLGIGAATLGKLVI